MRWGIFPPVVAYLFLVFRNRNGFIKDGSSVFKSVFSDGRLSCFALSGLLILVGFVFGALVRGPDLRLPGHYHASIGAVTLSFMGAVLVLMQSLLVPGIALFKEKLTRYQVPLYGFGQIAFSLGMFIAGTYGMARKTYGVEQQLRHPMQTFGMGVMGIGGLIALAGGFVFATIIYKKLMQLFRSSVSGNSKRNISWTPSSKGCE